MPEDEVTLEELSERTGVESRTLRSWVSEGLLAPPFKPGRGARYPASNVDRALAVRVLKDLYGLSLSEIGRRYMMASDEQIRQWAREAGATTAPRGSARDYLSRIRAQSPSSEPAQSSMDALRREPPSQGPMKTPLERRLHEKPATSAHGVARSEERQAELASIERLILHLEKLLDAAAPRRSRGAIWTRIAITPDLELSVRGDLEPHERVLFEHLADQFRAILTGGTKND